MDAEQWQQIKAAFERAIELPPEERAAYLDSLHNLGIRAEVASLLASRHEADDVLESPAIRLDAGSSDEPEHDPWIGKNIGAYHVISRIGHGGMGVVYRAVRTGDHFVKHVALKIVRSGIISEEAIRRFKNERQILASLEHANIARLLDGGTTENGLPYLIMEYIGGQPLDEYCDSHRLPVPERLKLFQSICSAVQYAHQNLVVHRDIKPGNILVTTDGTPKLLDFGIAKLLEPELYFQSVDPTVAFRPMTPEFASPEQIRGEFITTSSDIYSLGVVLYLLLTGHPPYRLDRTPPHELARTILETELERPSTALKRVEDLKTTEGRLIHVTPETVATARGEPPESLRRRLSGDLDNIVLKAMRKDPARRYVSVAQFSDDISRHLSGQPVIARKDTFRYRTSKFVSRHRAGVASAAVIFFLLIGGIITTTWQARVAHVQKAIANQRFEDVRALANSLIFDIHDAIQNLPGSTSARSILVQKALTYLDSLSKEPGGDRALKVELATAYKKLGDVQGYHYAANLGDTSGALVSYDKALKIYNSITAEEPPDIKMRQQLAELHQRICAVQISSGNLPGALEGARKSLAILQHIVDSIPEDEKARLEFASGLDQVGDVLVESGKLEEALQYHWKEQAIFEAAAGAPNARPAVKRALAICYKKIGGILEARNRISEAVPKYEQALKIDEAIAAADPTNPRRKRDLSISYVNIGDILIRQGDAAGALKRYQLALAINEELASADKADVRSREYLSWTFQKIGQALADEGSFEEARKSCKRAIAIFEGLSRADAANTYNKAQLANAYASLGNVNEKIASKAADPKGARRGWIEARAWYERSRSLWFELRKRNALTGLDEGKPRETAEAVSRCNAALKEH